MYISLLLLLLSLVCYYVYIELNHCELTNNFPVRIY